MRIAVISDIHGNLTALQAVLDDLRAVAPDLIVHGGDLVGSGSRPAEVVDIVCDQKWPGVYGNSDEMLWAPERVSETLSLPHLRPIRDMLLAHTIPATRDALGDARVTWLTALPQRWTAHDVTVVHASPSDCWRAPSAGASDDDLERTYGSLGASRVVYGHIHHPFVRRLPAITVANSGSVSLSYDGDPRAAYLLLDGDAIVVRRVQYDVEEEVKHLVQAGDPHAEWLAHMLRSGRYIPPPTAHA